MRSRCVIFFVSVALVATWAAAQNQKPATSPAATQVQNLEREWLDAYEKRDTAAMQRIVADEFLITFPDGSTQVKADLIAMTKQPPRPGQSAKFRTEQVRARAFGNTVVLTGRVIGAYVNNGKSTVDEMLYTDTYVRLNGRWQVVASHLTSAPHRK
jgi:ketosteroid isomerase-like protein